MAAALSSATSAFESVPTPKIALGRAMILTQMGRHDDAFEALIVARSLLRPGEDAAPIDAAITETGPHVRPPMGLLVVLDAPSEAVCRLGGKAWGCTTRAVGVQAGTHGLQIQGPGAPAKTWTVTVGAGEVARLTAPIPPAPKAVTLSPGLTTRQPETTSQPNILGWSLVGGGVALAGGALLAYVLAVDDHDEAEMRARSPGTSGFAELVDARDTKLTASRVLLGVGAAAIIGGVVALIVTPREHTGEGSGPSVQPRMGATGGGLVLGGAGRF